MKKKNIYNIKEVDTELLFRSFNNVASKEEEAMICEWLKESEDNRKEYIEARELHEALLMDAPIELFEGRLPESARKRRRALRFIMLSIGNVAVLTLFCFLGFNIINNRVEDRLANTMNTITVPAGKSMDYTLNDGTVIKLNSGARLQYPMVFAKGHRTVSLEGEAYFDVAHDAQQPFIVQTFASDIEVLGTEFNVKADEKSGVFSTTLVEGSVKLTSRLDGEQIIMKPNQTVSLMENGRFMVERKSTRSKVRWTEGIVAVDTHDFVELMEKLETAFGVKIIIESETTPELEYVRGEFRISDEIDSAMKILQDMTEFNYRKDYKTGTIYIR